MHKKHFKRIFLLICVFGTFGWLGMTPQTAQACSGAAAPFKDTFAYSDIVIKGRVVDADDAGQNVVVSVETYYKGGPGPDWMFIDRLESPGIAKIIGLMKGIRGYGNTCEWLDSPLYKGDTVYFSGRKTFKGTYEGLVFGTNASRSPGTNVFFNVFTDVTSESELLEYIAQNAPEPPVAPVWDSLYPRYAPLRVTTEKGTQYFLPVDGSAPQRLANLIPEPLSSYERLGDIRGYLAGPERTRCIGLNCEIFSYDALLERWDKGLKIPVKDYLAAHTGPDEAIAVWYKDRIQVNYKITIPFNAHRTMTTEESAKTAHWSDDGQKLAYSDAKGLWVWVREQNDNKPRQVLPVVDAIPTPRYFSPRGNFLAYTDGERRVTLDLATGKTFRDGLFSPNETYFLAFDAPDPKTGMFALRVYYNLLRIDYADLLDRQLQNMVDSRPVVRPDLDDIRKVVWTADNEYATLGKQTPLRYEGNGYGLQYTWVWGSHTRMSPNAAEPSDIGFDMTYDRANDTLAVIKSGTTITINGRAFDLSGKLDGRITQIDWFPTLMYREGK